MNINKFFLTILLGVIVFELSAKPKYRIETWIYNGSTYYLPERKVRIYIKGIPLPISVWRSGDFPYNSKQNAENIINNWKADEKAKKDWKKSKYIEFN